MICKVSFVFTALFVGLAASAAFDAEKDIENFNHFLMQTVQDLDVDTYNTVKGLSDVIADSENWKHFEVPAKFADRKLYLVRGLAVYLSNLFNKNRDPESANAESFKDRELLHSAYFKDADKLVEACEKVDALLTYPIGVYQKLRAGKEKVELDWLARNWITNTQNCADFLGDKSYFIQKAYQLASYNHLV